MNRIQNIADEFYINANLNTEISLPSERGTLLHYFEQIQKRYPTMRNFYARDRGEFVLEEDKDSGFYRWSTLEPKRIASGWVNPVSVDDAMDLHRLVFEMVPYTLNVSTLDCESLNLTFGFDFIYRGNHQELLAEALGYCSPFERTRIAGTKLIAHDYSLTLALEEDCRTQCRIHIEPRTTAYQIRTEEYGEEPLSVYLTVRRYGSLDPGDSYVELLDRLYLRAQDLIERYLIDQFLTPVQQAIAIK
jgi:hypothetical protein